MYRGGDGSTALNIVGETDLAYDGPKPIKILRTIHSFDPCIACAVHVVGPGRRGTGAGQGDLTGALPIESRLPW